MPAWPLAVARRLSPSTRFGSGCTISPHRGNSPHAVLHLRPLRPPAPSHPIVVAGEPHAALGLDHEVVTAALAPPPLITHDPRIADGDHLAPPTPPAHSPRRGAIGRVDGLHLERLGQVERD